MAEVIYTIILKILELAESQIGYTETGNNHNKYAQYFDTPKSKGGPYPWFNGKKQNVPWCAIFICWLFVMVLGPDKAREFLGCPEPADNCAAGVPYLWEYLKKKGYQVKDKSKGQPGDIIFLNGNKHVGIIFQVKDGKYITIEGNKSNKVAKGNYSVTSSTVYGIMRPDYAKVEPKVEDPKEDTAADPEPIEKPVADLKPEPVPEPTPEPLPKPEPVEPVKPTKSIDEYAKEVIAGKWGNNPQRAIKMKAAGIDYDAVQKRVNEILGVGQSSSSGKQYTVNVRADSYLNVRYGPNSDIKVGKLYRGDKVTVYEKKGNWGRIGTNRWVSMDYLK